MDIGSNGNMNWRDAIGFALCDLIAVIAVALSLLEPSDKSYAYIFVAFAILVYAFARTPNKHAKTKGCHNAYHARPHVL